MHARVMHARLYACMPDVVTLMCSDPSVDSSSSDPMIADPDHGLA
jgi:hypothetical protein